MTMQYPIQQRAGNSVQAVGITPLENMPWEDGAAGAGSGAPGVLSPVLWDDIAAKPNSFPTAARDQVLQLKDLIQGRLWLYEDFVTNALNTAPGGWSRSVGGDGVSSGRETNPNGIWSCTTAAGLGAGMGSIFYGSSGSINPVRVNEKPLAVFRFQQRIADAAGAFTWVGLGDTATFTTNSSAEFNDFIGLRYKNTAGVRTLEAVTRDDTIETATDLGLAIVVGRWYRFQIELLSTTSVVISVYDEPSTGGGSTIKVNHTTNLPDAGAFFTAGMKHYGDGGGGHLDYVLMFLDRTKDAIA